MFFGGSIAAHAIFSATIGPARTKEASQSRLFSGRYCGYYVFRFSDPPKGLQKQHVQQYCRQSDTGRPIYY